MTARQFLNRKNRLFAYSIYLPCVVTMCGVMLLSIVSLPSREITLWPGFALDRFSITAFITMFAAVAVCAFSYWRFLRFVAHHPEMNYIPDWKDAGYSTARYPVTEADKQVIAIEVKNNLLLLAMSMNITMALRDALPTEKSELGVLERAALNIKWKSMNEIVEADKRRYLNSWDLVVNRLKILNPAELPDAWRFREVYGALSVDF